MRNVFGAEVELACSRAVCVGGEGRGGAGGGGAKTEVLLLLFLENVIEEKMCGRES